jgi:hypothetical protein
LNFEPKIREIKLLFLPHQPTGKNNTFRSRNSTSAMTQIISLKKPGILLMLSLLIMSSCKEVIPNEPPVDAISTMENEKQALFEALKNFGNKYATAWSGKDPAAVAAYFALNGSLKINDAPPAEGREAITALAKAFMDVFPNMVVVMDSLVQHPYGLEFHWTLTGTYVGSDSIGRPVKISGVELWQLNKEGQVQTSVGSFDAGDYKRQISSQ